MLETLNELLAPWQQTFESWLGVSGWWLLPLLVIGLAIIADLVTRLLLWRLVPLLKKSKSRWDDTIALSIRTPLWVWIWGFALLYVATIISWHYDLGWLQQHLTELRNLFHLLILAWVGLRLTSRIKYRLIVPPAGHKAKPMDANQASVISKIVGATLLIVIGFLVLKQLGVSPSNLLAVGGLGGILIGFAARDVIANFFGGLAVHLDKPFLVGDWVCSPDRDIEGMVENIGWRLTRIRCFDSRPIYVPNALFSNIIVKNPSRMKNWRIYQTIGLRYEDIGQVRDITKAIREMLENHDSIDTNQFMLVNFKHYDDYSLNLFCYAFSSTTDWVEHQDIQQDVMLRIADIVHENGAELALPTREVHLKDAMVWRQEDHSEERETDDEHDRDRDRQNESRQKESDDDQAAGKRVDKQRHNRPRGSRPGETSETPSSRSEQESES